MGVGCVMVNRSISKQTLLRLPLYLNYMKQLGENTPEHISATTIAEAYAQGNLPDRAAPAWCT